MTVSMSTFQVRPPPRRYAHQDAGRLHGVRDAPAEDRAGRDMADDAAGRPAPSRSRRRTARPRARPTRSRPAGVVVDARARVDDRGGRPARPDRRPRRRGPPTSPEARGRVGRRARVRRGDPLSHNAPARREPRRYRRPPDRRAPAGASGGHPAEPSSRLGIVVVVDVRVDAAAGAHDDDRVTAGADHRDRYRCP